MTSRTSPRANPIPAPSSPETGFHLFTNLPSGLLDRLLTNPHLHATDLNALHEAAHLQNPALSNAVQTAATLLLQADEHGRTLLASPLKGEAPLSALAFKSLLNAPAPLSPHSSLWSCGRNDFGQAARPSSADTNSLLQCFRPVDNAFEDEAPSACIISISAGAFHSACLTSLGALHVTGSNSHGQLGVADSSRRSAWTHVADLKSMRICQVACGEKHTVVLSAHGAVYATGANGSGQLGLSDRVDRITFQPAVQNNAVMIAAGRSHTVVLLRDGSVVAAGENSNGQLGSRADDGLLTFRPVQCFGQRVVRIACGNDTTMLLTARNCVLATGKRPCGLSVIGGLGTSRISHLSVAERFAIVRTQRNDVAVSAFRKRFGVPDELRCVAASHVSAGVSHYVVLRTDGSVLAAGGNAFGQVGAGNMGLTLEGSPGARVIRTHQVQLSPVTLPTGYRALQAAAGAFHTVYLLAKND